MNEPKPYLLTLVTVFLTLIVGMMLSIAVYLSLSTHPPVIAYFFNSAERSKTETNREKKDSVKMYSEPAKIILPAVNIIDNPEDSVSLIPGSPNEAAASLQSLRNEIDMLLSKRYINAKSISDIEKINEINKWIAALKNKNKTVEEENRQLNSILKLLKQNIQKDNLAVSPKELHEVKKANNVKIESIQIKAVASEEWLNKETSKAEQTAKLAGSVVLAGNNNAANEEIMLVVIQPDGSVLQTSDWETGIFYSNTGKQIYTKKLRFSSNDGNNKKIDFSLQAEKYFPGKYTVEIYYGGTLLRTVTKILS